MSHRYVTRKGVFINIHTDTLYDEEGYDIDGYNKDGYNRNGYNREGKTKEEMEIEMRKTEEIDSKSEEYERTSKRKQ